VKREEYLFYPSIGFSRKSKEIVAMSYMFRESSGFLAGFLKIFFRFD
jgi:hypothetical protein